MSLVLDKNDDYQKRLEEAIEARQDGEPEASAAIFERLLADFPGDADATIEYAQTLKALGNQKDADLAFARAIEKNPGHFRLRKAWAMRPVQNIDHEELSRRGRVLRTLFPPDEFPESWQSLSIEFDGLFETAQWDTLLKCVEENWDGIVKYPNILPAGIAALNKLFLTDRLRHLVDSAQPAAWRNLPPEAAGNLRLRAELAQQNQALLAKTGVKVISLGQNCLPYLLGGAWGLSAPRADPGALTPFDLGGFRNDTVADAIDTDFAPFEDRDQYVIARAWGGGELFRHRPTGVEFFHERGPYWVTSDRQRFFARIDSMIANWRRIKSEGRRLFVFCYCGAGSLERVVEVASKHLLGPDAHLLIVDVLKQPHYCPPNANVTYRHTPYPDDFEWTSTAHQNSVRGMKFELSVINPIMELLTRFGSEDDAALAAAGQRHSMLVAARKARASGDVEKSATLFSSLLAQFPDDVPGAMEYVQLLRGLQRQEEADEVITRAIGHAPANFALHQIWAEIPFHSADWDTSIERARTLRATFPPHTHPLSWQTLNVELTALYDSGRWADANGLIERHRQDFASRPELFSSGVDILARLFRHDKVLSVLDAATPEALQVLSPEILANIRQQQREALGNQRWLRDSGVRVMSLGRNAMPFTIAGRWGLNAGAADFNALTPFDICEFPPIAAAKAVASDFSAYADQDQFVARPAWFGGSMLVHRTTGANFFSHRRAKWLEGDRRTFFAHWDAMLANWRSGKDGGRRVFLLSISDKVDLNYIVAILDEHLLRPDGHLVIIDTLPVAEPPSVHERVTHIHAPLPENYAWTRLTACATPTVLDYETQIIAAIKACIPPTSL